MKRTLVFLFIVFLAACIKAPTETSSEETLCTPGQKQADLCTANYDPVCGWFDPAQIQCIRYPCAATYGNACEACKDEKVKSWSPGDCPP